MISVGSNDVRFAAALADESFLAAAVDVQMFFVPKECGSGHSSFSGTRGDIGSSKNGAVHLEETGAFRTRIPEAP